jgi:hypothetical protein
MPLKHLHFQEKTLWIGDDDSGTNGGQVFVCFKHCRWFN